MLSLTRVTKSYHLIKYKF